MSIAAAQYSKFMTQVAAEGKVFTFTKEGAFLVYPMKEAEVIPFWSSRQRLLKIQATLPKYEKFQMDEMSVKTFLKQLSNLHKKKIRIGVNWSGKNLAGYDVSVADLKAALDYALKK
jgi:hypothetical protein